jgi:hypothetical protein
MGTADYVLGSASEMDRFVRLLAGARGAPDVVAAVSEYLAAWPSERVAGVQRVDAGWAPFDDRQRPTPLYRPADVHRICEAVHGQCAALRGAGLTLAPELLELDLFLFLACAKLAELQPGIAAASAPQPSSRPEVPPGSSVHRGSGHLA